jgi:hypothetical protein
LVTNESIDHSSDDYDVAMKDIREDIMCSIIEQKFFIGDDKQRAGF